MIPVDSCSVIPLHANYYLFGVYFPGKTGEDDEDIVYPEWHKEPSLVDKKMVLTFAR